jgi:hypothetical protein
MGLAERDRQMRERNSETERERKRGIPQKNKIIHYNP